MNCAPITVTGPPKKRDVANYDPPTDSIFVKRDASFPQMFVANIGNQCTSVDSADLLFPNPGSVVQKVGRFQSLNDQLQRY